MLEKIKELKEETYERMSDNAKDFVDDYDYHFDSIHHISDDFTEFADSHTSIYYEDQRNYYRNNTDECMNALRDFGFTLEDMAKEGLDLDDMICKAGAVGEFREIENELYQDEDEIKEYILLTKLIDFMDDHKDIIIDDDKLDEMLSDSHSCDEYCEFDDIVSTLEPEEE